MNAPLDIKSYMLEVGMHARAAAREVARADTDTKNRALLAAAKAIRRDQAERFVLILSPFAPHLADVTVGFVASLIPALRAGRIDVIMSGMSVTPERSQLVSFTDWMVVAQLNEPFEGMYSVVKTIVQSSTGSTLSPRTLQPRFSNSGLSFAR